MADTNKGERMSLLDLRNRFGDVLDSEGFDENDLAKEARKLRVLSFYRDRKKTDVVSDIDGKIVFIVWNHKDRVAEGDAWLCSVTDIGTVYNAVPMLKITAATAMDLSENVRSGIIDALWEKNKASYEKKFSETYREKVYAKAMEESESRHKDIIDTLQREKNRLQSQLDKSRYIIDSRNTEDAEFEEEEILLGAPAEPMVADIDDDEEISLSPAPAPVAVQEKAPPMRFVHPIPITPGLPEMRVLDNPPQTDQVHRQFIVERLDARTLYCDSFADGKYFVHINMSKRFLIIRPNSNGYAFCVNRRIILDGLEDLSSFVGPKRLMAEWNERYDGLLVYL